MNHISTITFNINDLTNLVDYDCVKSDSFEELICENDGHFSREGEFLAFDINGLELVIFYDLDVSGRIDYDPGDYYNPPYTDVNITDETINVTQVTLDDYDIELTNELNQLFESVVKKYI